MNPTTWLLYSLIVATFTFVLVRAWDWWWRRKRLEAHRTALAAEMAICSQDAHIYCTAGIQAPSYRLPTLIYTGSLPDLIANGALSAQGVDALIRFYNQAEALNRGLDQINQARFAGDSKAYTDEHNRNLIKAEELVSKFYPPARYAVAPKTPRRILAWRAARAAFAPKPPWHINDWFQGGP